jgi:hypothetical protein
MSCSQSLACSVILRFYKIVVKKSKHSEPISVILIPNLNLGILAEIEIEDQIGRFYMSIYQLNPRANLNLQIATPVPGKGMQRIGIGQQKNANTAEMLNYLFSSGILQSLAQVSQQSQINGADLDPVHLSHFIKMGLLVPAGAEAPEVIYFCPCPPLTSAPATGSTYLQTESSLPPALQGQFELPHNFSPARPILWIDDPQTQMLWPYWQQVTTQLSTPVTIENLSSPLQPGGLHVWKQELQNQGFVVLRQIIPHLQQIALIQYLDLLVSGGYFDQGSTQVPLRNVIHSEPLMVFLLSQLTNLLNSIVPFPVKPSYSYLADYQSGAVLDKHVDREQCLWNVSLVLKTEPVVSINENWPIWLDLGNRSVAVHLQQGDAILYPGSRIPHWREALPTAQRVCVGLFHFVGAHFQGPLL